MRAIFIFLFLTLPMAAILFLVLFFNSKPSTGQHETAGGPVDEETLTIAEMRQHLLRKYIEQLDPEELAYDSIKGMISRTIYSTFEQDEEKFQEEISGKYTGIGILLKREGGKLLVKRCLMGSEAYRSLQPGDEILRIDDFLTEGLTIPEAVERLKGKSGTRCKLLVRKAGSRDIYEYSLKHEELILSSAYGDRILDEAAGIGYIRIAKFQDATGDEFRQLLELLAKDRLRGLILDLRFNSGGLLDVAIKIANLFIAEGLLARTEGRYDQACREFPAKRISCLYPDLELVVLINHETASAAEVLAGTLQDHRRAKLVGTRSMGKGLVQSCDRFQIKGKNVFLKFPSARIYLPSGRCIDRKLGNQDVPGLQPDVPVNMTKAANIKLAKYLEALGLACHPGHNEPVQDTKVPFDPQLATALRMFRKK